MTDLERFLNELGVRAQPTAPKPQPTRLEYPKPTGWMPSYPGEEPPF